VDKFLDGSVKKTNELGVRYVPLIWSCGREGAPKFSWMNLPYT
jgi:hypothetical protein